MIFGGLRRTVRGEPAIAGLAVSVVVVLAIGTVFYHLVEGWSVVNALYFCTVTLATIGYGDFAPQTEAGRIFTIGYIIFGLGVFATLAATVATARLKRISARQQRTAKAASEAIGRLPRRRYRRIRHRKVDDEKPSV